MNSSDGQSWTHDYVYSATPIIVLNGGWFSLRGADGARAGRFDVSVTPQPQRLQWANAWVVLAHTRTWRDPEGDAEFLGSLSVAPPSDIEQLRRIQVQVELALRANRNIDAARLYRDALLTAPAWAEGHFNLGLLYGDLELYPEAITEMRRYLHLSPNAADARAVQDRIYEWQAAMTPN